MIDRYGGKKYFHDMKTFKPYAPNQSYLLPPSMANWLSEGHLALFISDVVDHLDLKTIFDDYEKGGERGQPPCHPAMMMKLLVYGYCTGKPSSRKIERATWVSEVLVQGVDKSGGGIDAGLSDSQSSETLQKRMGASCCLTPPKLPSV